MTGPDIDAVVLAGGRGRRMGGRDKAMLRLGGERLVDRAVAAVRRAGARRIVVVGPAHAHTDGVLVVREDPPFTGPLAALAAALPHVRAEWMLLLSCDLVRPDAVCALLGAQLADTREHDGIVLRDDTGREQWLAGVYRSAVLRERVDALGERLAHASLRRALDGLRLRSVAAPGETTADIDEPADLERAVAGGGGRRWGVDSLRSLDRRRRRQRTVGARSAADPDPSRRPRTKETDMSDPKHLPPQALDEWLIAAAAELGLEPGSVSIGTVLDVARDVAHDVARPAAPLSTFLLGLAVARSDDPDALRALAARLTARAAEWKAAAGDADPAG